MGEVEPPEDEVIGALNDGEQGKRQVLLSAPVLRPTDALPHVVTVRMLALPHLHPLYEVWQVDDVSCEKIFFVFFREMFRVRRNSFECPM